MESTIHNRPKLPPIKIMVIEVLAWCCILLFAYAAMDKLINFELFNTQLGKSPLLLGMSSWMAWVVPFVELGICGLLFFNRTRVLGFYAFFFQMILFAFYIIALLNFSFYVPCSCGALLSSLSWLGHVIFNIAFALLAAVGISLIQSRAVQKGNNYYRA